MIQNTMVVGVIVLFIAWYYYQKFQESEREYYRLHKRFTEVINDNVRMKARVRDLQSYKNDVSKTFKILDNELLMINDHMKKQNGNSLASLQIQSQPRPNLFRWSSWGHSTNTNTNTNTNSTLRIPQNRVSILTPDVLSSLFTNMNQERVEGNTSRNDTDTTNTTNTADTANTAITANNTNAPNTNNNTFASNNTTNNNTFASNNTTNNNTFASNNTTNNNTMASNLIESTPNTNTVTSGSGVPVTISSVTYDIGYTPGDILSGEYEQFMINNSTQES
uniref:Uncharacterized protein n=1 Tax=viral metagenome TaxID=1070528 RepID=A0A6C0H7D8_9ZZZZ